MGLKRPVTDVWGDRIEKETIRGRNDVFVARFARLKPNWKKLRYIVILRETGFRNIPMKYFEIFIWNIYSQITTKMAVTTSMAALYFPVRKEKNTTTSNLSFLRTLIIKDLSILT